MGGGASVIRTNNLPPPILNHASISPSQEFILELYCLLPVLFARIPLVLMSTC